MHPTTLKTAIWRGRFRERIPKLQKLCAHIVPRLYALHVRPETHISSTRGQSVAQLTLKDFAALTLHPESDCQHVQIDRSVRLVDDHRGGEAFRLDHETIGS